MTITDWNLNHTHAPKNTKFAEVLLAFPAGDLQPPP